MMMFNNFKFGVVENVAASMLGIAVGNNEGALVSYDKEKKEIVNVEGFTFDSFNNMFYSMPCKISKVNVGDVILHHEDPVFVVENNNDILKVVDPKDGTRKEILPTKTMFGFNFVTKVVSLIDFSDVFKDEEEKGTTFEKMLPFMMMNNASNYNSMNNLLPLLLMKDDEGGKDYKTLMLMMALSQNGKDGSEGNNFFPMMMAMKDLL